MNPLKDWLQKKNWKLIDLVTASGADIAHVSRVVNGQTPPNRRLREYLEKAAPEVALKQTRYHGKKKRALEQAA